MRGQLRQKNALQTIERMISSDRPVIADHGRLNFQPVTYSGGNGQARPMYRMTPKGLSELAMSFTGDDARAVRIRFLDAFEEVAERPLRASRALVAQLPESHRRPNFGETVELQPPWFARLPGQSPSRTRPDALWKHSCSLA